MAHESVYPGVIDTIADVFDWNAAYASGTQIGEATCNSRSNAIIAVQETLGANPQGAFATVVERLDNVDDQLDADVTFTQSTDDFSDPPTSNELTTIFGDPSVLGRGFVGFIDDNDEDAKCYIVWTSDASWYYLSGAKATGT